MLWKMTDLQGFSIRATDGEVGRIDDLLFSDDSWAVRYLVVTTGDWLSQKAVLVSPLALEVPNGPARVVPASVTREQIEAAPSVDAKKPVSRQYELEVHHHYGWPYYWVGGPMWGPYLTPGELARAGSQPRPDAERERVSSPEDAHLRSCAEVKGYRFEGSDGELGHVEDFLIEDSDWAVHYLEIDTRNWWPGGKKVLLARDFIREVHWSDRKVKADQSRDAVKNAPEYDQSTTVSAEYLRALAEHYSARSR